MSATQIEDRLRDYRNGYSLPRDFYISDEIFEDDLAAIFETEWLFACNGAEIAAPGDYVTFNVGTNPIVVLRDRDGQVRAFHNACRHRGSKVCQKDKGHTNRLVCPYHQWVYELDGRLIHARQMPDGFDTSGSGLAPVQVEVVAGLVYVCLADAPPSLARFKAAVTSYIAPHAPDRTKVAFQSTIIEKANWKLVIENNRECYHCAGNHPELLASLVEFALPDDTSATASFEALMARSAATWDAQGLPHEPADGGIEFRCIRLPFNEGAVSFTLDGKPACAKLVGDLTHPDLGSVRMFRVPNNWNHFLADHILNFRVLPLSADRTAVTTTWLVHEDAVEGIDYDLEHLTAVWTATNDQDRALAENNHLGIRSKAYRPGPYAPSEFMLTNFADWYVGRMRGYCASHAAVLEAAE